MEVSLSVLRECWNALQASYSSPSDRNSTNELTPPLSLTSDIEDTLAELIKKSGGILGRGSKFGGLDSAYLFVGWLEQVEPQES